MEAAVGFRREMFRRSAPTHEIILVPLGKGVQDKLAAAAAAAKKRGQGAQEGKGDDKPKLSLKMLQKKESDDKAAAAVWEV